MNEDQRNYEIGFEELVCSIKGKRENFYSDYDLEAPSKDKALSLLHQL
jgi:hypothetical protein